MHAIKKHGTGTTSNGMKILSSSMEIGRLVQALKRTYTYTRNHTTMMISQASLFTSKEEARLKHGGKNNTNRPIVLHYHPAVHHMSRYNAVACLIRLFHLQNARKNKEFWLESSGHNVPNVVYDDSSYADKCVIKKKRVYEWVEIFRDGQSSVDDGTRSRTSCVKVRRQIDRCVWLSWRIGTDVTSCEIRSQSWQNVARECYWTTESTSILMESRNYWATRKTVLPWSTIT